MTGRPQSIPLDAILTDPRLQNRNVGMQKFKEHGDAKRYKDHINQLTRSINAKGQEVPVQVIAADEGGSWELAAGADRPHFVPARFWLVDGHHRVEALKKAGRATVLADILPGRGINDALVASRLANPQVVQPLSPQERTENAWAAFNLPSDHYRKMRVDEAAAVLMVSAPTIKRFREAVREDGVRSGKINPDAPRDKVEAQLQAYWNRKTTWHRGSVVTWRQFREARAAPRRRTSTSERVHQLCMALAQTAFGEDRRYEDGDIQKALQQMGREAARPDGAEALRAKYKPKIYQPAVPDEEEDQFDHVQLGMDVARLHSEHQATSAS